MALAMPCRAMARRFKTESDIIGHMKLLVIAQRYLLLLQVALELDRTVGSDTVSLWINFPAVHCSRLL